MTRQKATLFALMLALHCVTLAEFSKRQEVCSLAWDSGRRDLQFRPLIGSLHNMIPCCVTVDGPFNKFLRVVQEEWFRSYGHGLLPFDRLLPMLNSTGERRCFPQVNFLARTFKEGDGEGLATSSLAGAGPMAHALRKSAWLPQPGSHESPPWSYEPVFALRIRDAPQVSIMMHSAYRNSRSVFESYLARMRALAENVVGTEVTTA